MSRRVLVTGGAGFIGSHLVEALVSAGDEVAVLDDLSRGRRVWVHPEAELHELDIRDSVALRGTAAQLAPDVVVHLAAMHFIPAVETAPQLARDVNVNGTERLLEALEPHPPKLLVFASTAAVYPDRRGPIDESCAVGPIDVYGKTKLEAEHLVRTFAAQTGIRAIVVRLFNVVGKRETNPHVVPEVVQQLREGAASIRVGNLNPRRDYTDVRDIAEALQRLLVSNTGRSVVFNVGSGRSVSVAELVELCGEILNRQIDVNVDERRVRTLDRVELVADPHLLRATTGWQAARSLRQTLAELLTEATG
jgi:UDP-glucose 4-epimerase